MRDRDARALLRRLPEQAVRPALRFRPPAIAVFVCSRHHDRACSSHIWTFWADSARSFALSRLSWLLCC
jgi:hypothetical protein